VLGAEGWHAGVIGIVASRVVNRLNRPTIMVALSNGEGHGSGRSVPGFHLARALAACGEHLLAAGGHEMAAGLRLDRAKFEAFREAFAAYARGMVSREMLVPCLNIDCMSELRQLSEPVVRDLQRLGPFGTANPRPLLCCTGLEVAGVPRRVGKSGDHVQFLARQAGVSMKCIAFNYGEIFNRLTSGTKIDLAVEPSISEYNGYRNVELEVKDLRFAL
jgi:single-stranded-DNA-specific exonuclease